MHTITLTEEEMMLLEMCLVDTMDRLMDNPEEEETYDAVSQLLEKVIADDAEQKEAQRIDDASWRA